MSERVEEMARRMFEDTIYPADDGGAMGSEELRKASRELATACFVAAEEFYAVASERAADRMRRAS
jgi:hypothetical protein